MCLNHRSPESELAEIADQAAAALDTWRFHGEHPPDALYKLIRRLQPLVRDVNRFSPNTIAVLAQTYGTCRHQIILTIRQLQSEVEELCTQLERITSNRHTVHLFRQDEAASLAKFCETLSEKAKRYAN